MPPVNTAKTELQRLKPISLRGIYVVAKATTHKDSRRQCKKQNARLKAAATNSNQIRTAQRLCTPQRNRELKT
jgi:hypothetical protein